MYRLCICLFLCIIASPWDASDAFMAPVPTTKWSHQQNILPHHHHHHHQKQRQHSIPSIAILTSRMGHNNDKDTAVPATTSSFRRRWRKRIVRFGQTLMLASAFSATAPKAAHAKFSHELQEERTLSLRPGVSMGQANTLNEGEIPDDLPESTSALSQNQKQEEQETAAAKKSSSASNKAFDYGDDDEDDDFDDFLDEQDNAPTRKAPGARTSVSKKDVAKASDFQASTKSQFSGMGPKSQSQAKLLTLKVSVGLFIPTWGAMGVREFVRRRKEEAYVQKGLEILEVQKAEYFNITDTKSDSDNDDDGDDDDSGDDDDDDDDEGSNDNDDDDDDDDHDDDAPASRRRPKRPSGGSGGSDDSGSPGSGGDGDGRPSDEDLKRLGDLFDKS